MKTLRLSFMNGHLVSPLVVIIVVILVCVAIAEILVGAPVVDPAVLVRPRLLRHLLVQLRLEHRPHLSHELAQVVLVLVRTFKERQT